jgi:hypothetical protein
MENQKKLILAVAGVTTLGLLFVLFKKSSAQTPQIPNRPQTPNQVMPEPDNMPPDIADMPVVGFEPTEPKVDLKGLVQAPNMANLSNLLFDAFNGAGTTWKDGQFGGVYGVFSQLKSDNDFDSLNEYYGIRRVNGGIFRKDYTGDMNSTMNYELSKREIRLINELLEKNGVIRRIIINEN